MNFGDGYDYEEVDRAYIAGMDDGGERGYNVGYNEGYQDGMRAAVDTTEPGSEWVRTADRLPTESDGEYVIARNKHGYMAGPDVRLVDIELLNRLKEDFTYWMPLPKLPEVEE